MQLEVDFFSAQPLGADHWAAAGDTFLVMDFDETMTQADSTAAIIETAIAAAAARHGGLAACKQAQVLASQCCLLVWCLVLSPARASGGCWVAE